MRYAIIRPMLQINGFELQFSSFYFLLLTISTVLIAAAGYVINDYFDRKTDLINHPQSVILGRIIRRRSAIMIHLILNTVAVILGFYISYRIGMVFLGIIFVLIVGILWFYSTTYKRQVFIGNLVVAVLTALVPLMVLLFEYPLLNKAYGSILKLMGANFNYLTAWIFNFSAFAFLTNLSREIVKDIEDYEGDKSFGRETLPLVIGVNTTRGIIVGLESIMLLALLFLFVFYLNDWLTFLYFLTAIAVPIIFTILNILRANDKSSYHRASTWIKITMLTGILYAPISCYIIHFKF
ncbi:MAG: geranylgeranylglycerol-phosphate geranylgeranyltransferase [Bacteroidales bacterium]|nr:geranylgeranylglycerol-phosphate geranylgeranyltransferase [Bacteroidales bacterium]